MGKHEGKIPLGKDRSRWVVLLAQDHDNMEYMARKLKEEYEKWGLAINLEKN